MNGGPKQLRFDSDEEAIRILSSDGFRVDRAGERKWLVFASSYECLDVNLASFPLAEIEAGGQVVLCDTKDNLIRNYHVQIARLLAESQPEQYITSSPDVESDISVERVQRLLSQCNRAHIRILDFAKDRPYFFIRDIEPPMSYHCLDELEREGLLEKFSLIPVKKISDEGQECKLRSILYCLTPLGSAVLRAYNGLAISEDDSSHPYR